MIEKATKNHADKIPEYMSVIEIPGGGDSLVHALSLILFEWKRQEGKFSNYEIFNTENILPLREKLQKHIYSNPERYGITLNKENRREWQSYALQGVTLRDEFIQCFVNLYKCEIELYFSNTSPVIFQCDDPKKTQPGKIGRLQIKGGTHFNVLKNVKNIEKIDKSHIMFHKKIEKIKSNCNDIIDKILIDNSISENITVKHSSIEVKIDRLDRRFTNDFRCIHDSLPLESFKTHESIRLNDICNITPNYNIPDNILQCSHK
ncbi:unnamed protein product, partial [Rotaria magnacalcarata]